MVLRGLSLPVGGCTSSAICLKLSLPGASVEAERGQPTVFYLELNLHISVKVDTGKRGLEVFFKPWQVEALRVLEKYVLSYMEERGLRRMKTSQRSSWRRSSMSRRR